MFALEPVHFAPVLKDCSLKSASFCVFATERTEWRVKRVTAHLGQSTFDKKRKVGDEIFADSVTGLTRVGPGVRTFNLLYSHDGSSYGQIDDGTFCN